MINTNQLEQKSDNWGNTEFSYDYHPVFDTELDLFLNIKDNTVAGHITLLQYLELVKYRLVLDPSNEFLNGERTNYSFKKSYIDIFLAKKYIDGVKNEGYAKLKENYYPAICFNATFNQNKNLKNLKSITNLMFLDIDIFKTKEEAISYRNLVVKKYSWIVASTLSISKIGLHIIILIDEILNNEDYNTKYDFISKEYFEGKLDNNAKSLTRFTIIPYDNSPYINYYPTSLSISKLPQSDITPILSNDKELNVNKSTLSVYNENQSPPAGGEEILYNNCTFFDTNNTLDIKQYLSEDTFIMNNFPKYIHEGIEVVDLNLYFLKYKNITDGTRHITLGNFITRLLYLNGQLKNNKSEELLIEISKFINSINAKHCEPPLNAKELNNLIEWNWKAYLNNDLNFNKLKKKKRVFWSRHATLRGNEKRKVTYQVRKRVIEFENKKAIREAINILKSESKVIDQRAIAEIVGKSVNWVKMNWGEFKDEVISYNAPIRAEKAKAKRRKSSLNKQSKNE